MRAADPQQARIQLLEDGFILVQTSRFEGPKEEVEEKALGAAPGWQSEVVVFSEKPGKTVRAGLASIGDYSGTAMAVLDVELTAYYWRPAPRMSLTGLVVRRATAEEHAAGGTNHGVTIEAVVRGGPAFNAEVLAGDLLLKVGDRETDEPEDVARVAHLAGQAVPMVIRRNGQEQTKMVTLTPR